MKLRNQSFNRRRFEEILRILNMPAERAASPSVDPTARTLFGTDGVRGVANVDPMTPEMALRLGRAIAYHFQHPTKKSDRQCWPRSERTGLVGFVVAASIASVPSIATKS